MQRYEAKLARYAKKFLTHPDDCQDVVQEVFIKAYTNIKSFDHSRRFSPWIYRIAHNEFINTIRKKQREPVSFFDTDIVFPHPAAKETAEGDAQQTQLKANLQTLVSKGVITQAQGDQRVAFTQNHMQNMGGKKGRRLMRGFGL